MARMVMDIRFSLCIMGRLVLCLTAQILLGVRWWYTGTPPTFQQLDTIYLGENKGGGDYYRNRTHVSGV
jgi:hypothetical protein